MLKWWRSLGLRYYLLGGLWMFVPRDSAERLYSETARFHKREQRYLALLKEEYGISIDESGMIVIPKETLDVMWHMYPERVAFVFATLIRINRSWAFDLAVYAKDLYGVNLVKFEEMLLELLGHDHETGLLFADKVVTLRTLRYQAQTTRRFPTDFN